MAALRRFLVLPRVIWYAARAPRGRDRVWDTYWRDIGGGGADGDVLWDGATDRGTRWCLDQALRHFDPALPVVDVACGNGTQALLLADRFAPVVGVDVSGEAVARARQRAAGRSRLSFRVADITRPGAGRDLAAELGPANVHIRGLLHILDERQRRAAAGNLADLAGERGVVLLVETAGAGGALRYLEQLGVRLTAFPQTVARCLRAGLPIPRDFGERELARAFPADRWQVLTTGTTDLDVVVTGGPTAVPAFYAVLKRRT
ncbi:class I SAM-dependent methyltransferase [Actinoplanes utahensis]|uniref:Methyltransferase domain-containing protein n=1 Tax=Actinoplanes utahensis TaxID=1869 RepID=A0A0A6UIC6_ACTUT|nr:class I SAM-dependent methyltransferase [Actinoplanes utahensis]KHD75830.1 hypothetical protein MB27_20545 [Actinoplanes utahensis]GIF32230.1 hypothetical protein Aut01nite_52160 [Actinoplanes utahensis]